jgi:hypothetical protein
MKFKKTIQAWKNTPSWPRWLFLCFAAWFVWGLLDSLVNKQALFNSLLKRIPSLLLEIKIPDSIFLLAFVAVTLSLWRLNKKIKNFMTISQRRNLYFANNAFWVRAPLRVPQEGPFCPKCYSDGKEIRMINTYERANEVKCPVCGLTTISSQPGIWEQIHGG